MKKKHLLLTALCLSTGLLATAVVRSTLVTGAAPSLAAVTAADDEETTPYPVNYAEGTQITHSARSTGSVSLTSGDGYQTVTVSQPSDKLLYQDALSQQLRAKAGEQVTPRFGYNGEWMHGYVYIDRDFDGQFSVSLGTDGIPTAESDLLAYAYYKKLNSAGQSVEGSNTQPPAFTIPADLTPGYYRMRWKMDWDDTDPGGSTSQNLPGNGGVIIDTRINIHEDEVALTLGEGATEGGTLVQADGSALPERIAFGQAFTIKAEAEDGYELTQVTVRHGYFSRGEEVYGTRQYEEFTLTADDFTDGTYTLPASCVDGNVELTAKFFKAYARNFSDETLISHTSRYTTGVTLVSADGSQTVSSNQATDKLLYQNETDQQLRAKAGEQVTPTMNYPFEWMHSYIYLDRNFDGVFSTDLNEDGTPTETSDVMAYSYYDSKNSTGATAAQTDVQTPAFTVPADLTPGFYRMRWKVDWDCIDPAGNNASNNLITNNGGVIIDTRLNVHEDEVALTLGQSSAYGTLTQADGMALPERIAFGQELTIKAAPADGYELAYVTVRHGYFDRGAEVFGTKQYDETTVSALFFTDGTYTLPASYVDGNVELTAHFTEKGGGVEPGEEYALNFSEDLLSANADSKLGSLSVTGTTSTTEQTVTLPADGPDYVYRNLCPQEVGAVPGESLTFGTDYTGEGMHLYLYVDLNNDGHFSGTATPGSELVAYSYYNGQNSLGQAVADASAEGLATALPAFTLPDMLPTGIYRARLKVDKNNIDPAGQWADGGEDNIDANGGKVVDFLLNVHAAAGRMDVETTNGSVVGSGSLGMPETVAYGTGLTLIPVGLDENYVAEKLVIRHGHNLDGEQYIHGNRQWSEYEVSADAAYQLPADSVNGDVRVTADFEDQGSEYKLYFSDEFNGIDGSLPDVNFWNRSDWASPTWNRFTARTEEGQRRTGYIEDGKLVLLCMPNTLDDEQDNSGNKLQMISGAIETREKVPFLYGKIEGRLKTTGHTGNFPAFWMMPKDNSEGWPNAGEIDIWEQIDAQNTTWHTIHSHWANTDEGGLGQSSNPTKTGSSTAMLGNYHTFSLEWTEDLLVWYVNGRQVFSYAKSNDSYAIENGQWPFDKPFYLILNQSAGNNSWAANADLNYTYETKFDWVRVYQKESGPTGVTEAEKAKFDCYAYAGRLRLVAPAATKVTIADMQGRVVYSQTVQGNVDVALQQGVYVVNGKKVLVP